MVCLLYPLLSSVRLCFHISGAFKSVPYQFVFMAYLLINREIYKTIICNIDSMKLTLYNVGKTDNAYIMHGIDDYKKRIMHFADFSIIDIHAVKHSKSTTPAELTAREGEIILDFVSGNNLIVLLDEKGKEYTTREFSDWLKRTMNQSIKKVAFISGGAYGFSEDVYQASHLQISLSKMTFTHQMARLIFIEQLYRALTIIRGIPYHND